MVVSMFLIRDDFGKLHTLQATELPPEVIEAIEGGVMTAIRFESSMFQEWDDGKWIDVPPFGDS